MQANTDAFARFEATYPRSLIRFADRRECPATPCFPLNRISGCGLIYWVALKQTGISTRGAASSIINRHGILPRIIDWKTVVVARTFIRQTGFVQDPIDPNPSSHWKCAAEIADATGTYCSPERRTTTWANAPHCTDRTSTCPRARLVVLPATYTSCESDCQCTSRAQRLRPACQRRPANHISGRACFHVDNGVSEASPDCNNGASRCLPDLAICQHDLLVSR